MKRVLCALMMLVLLAQPHLSFSREERVDLKDLEMEVEVRGEVENPGVFVMRKGDTMQELLEKLILKPEADTDAINLLIPLKDKDLIIIEKKKSKEEKDSLVSLNNADKELLMTLPGIGEKTAEAILEYRRQKGYFQKIEELMNVKGIGQKKWEKIRPFVRL